MQQIVGLLDLDSDSMQIAKIFSSKFDDEKLKYDEREKKQKEDIEKYVSGKDIAFIKKTLDMLDSVYKDAVANNDGYWIESSLLVDTPMSKTFSL